MGPQGPQGPAGTSSITSNELDAGSRECVFGGARFTVGTSITAACNGAPGSPGPQGPMGNPGVNGAGFARTYVVVATGTATQNGTLLRNTLANITSPTASSPARLIVEPGVYDVGNTPLVMRRYVDLVGGGAHVTRIVGSNTQAGISFGVVTLADDMVLRGVTVENAHGNSMLQATGVGMVSGSALLRLRDVTVSITQPCSVAFATYFSNTTVELDGVTIIASGGVGTGPSANQGLRMQSGTAIFRNGTIRAGFALTDPIGNGQGTFRVVNSMVDGATNGTRTCVGAYGAQYTPLSSTCE